MVFNIIITFHPFDNTRIYCLGVCCAAIREWPRVGVLRVLPYVHLKCIFNKNFWILLNFTFTLSQSKMTDDATSLSFIRNKPSRDTWQNKIQELLPSVPMMNIATLTTGRDTQLVADKQVTTLQFAKMCLNRWCLLETLKLIELSFEFLIIQYRISPT